MATKLKTDDDWTEHDVARTALAVQEIAASPNLRFLFRSLLAACGVSQTPEGGNAIETARAIGRHSVGMDIVATILAEQPSLYPLLITEDLNEIAQRTGGTYDEHS